MLLTPSNSYSSSSSAHDSASPSTPSEPFLEPHLKHKTRPPLVPDYPLSTENGQGTLFTEIHSLLLPSQQKLNSPETPRPSKQGPASGGDPLGIAPIQTQPSGTPSGPPHGTQPSSPSTSSGSRVGADDEGSVYSSRHSTAFSDAGAGIGLSMLQDFPSDNADQGEDDPDEDRENSDHESLSQSERGRTSLEETVDGFPAPPTQIPTSSSHANSFILDPHRPISSVSEDSEDGDGASFYDNYCYSRLSISSKMSKSSGHTVATIPPPIPTELPPQVRSHSQGSQYSVPTEPLSSSSEPSSSSSPPPCEVTLYTAATQATTRTIPPPLILENSEKDPEPSNSIFVTATTSPLLHGNFGAPQCPPSHPDLPTKRSPVGTATAMRQKVEQSVIEDINEMDVRANMRGTSPQSSTPLSVATALGSPTTSTASEKKRGDGPPPFHVTNPTPPPPPYTPKAPPLRETTSTPLTLTLTTVPTSTIPHTPSPAGAMTRAISERKTDASQALTTANSRNLFLPHPNAPKPNSSPQAPLYGRAMPPAPLLPPTSLIQAMRRAAQMCVGPNGFQRFCTIYGSTPQDLSTAAGPVLMYFSLDPPNDIPANRIRVAPAPAPAPVVVTVPPQPLPPPAPVRTLNQNYITSIPAPVAQQPFPGQPGQRRGSGATTDVIPRPGFVPKAGAVRPRSRSFSGFDSAMAPGTQSKDERHVLRPLNFFFFFAETGTVHSRETKASSRPSTADSAPGSSSRVNRLAVRAAAHTARIHQSRQYTPSPLSLSQSTTRPGLSSSVPISPSTSSHPPPSPTSPTLRRRLTPVKSEPSLRSSARKFAPKQDLEAPISTPVPAPALAPHSTGSKLDGAASSRIPTSLSSTVMMNAPPSIRISVSESRAMSSHTTLGNESAFLRSRPRRQSSESPRHNSSTAMDVDGSSSRPSDLRAQVPLPPSTSAPSLGRSGSLRSKISLSALRAKSARDDDGLHEADTVQVKDTDFELVRPNVRPRVSEDSAINGKSSGSEGRPSFLRIDSPAMSMASGGGTSDTRSPVSPSRMSLPQVTSSAPSSVGTDVEAHRARELKWISVIATTPPSQARKGKKIRKLLQEGVPGSVRYQVWAHLTDSKAKRLEGLYAQFGERERVPAFAEIQRDAQVCFEGDPRLSLPNGPLVSLLQAYLTMVPDIRYSKGGFFYSFSVWKN